MDSLKLVVALVFCVLSLLSNGQNTIKKYVQDKTVQINAIEPDVSDLSDLEAIGKSIGDARIVMLGEQDHGDAPTFLAKTRLIKYLHEQKGFNVLAFEEDFFSINYNWQFVKSGRLPVDSFITKNISPTWSHCAACQPLFKQYIPYTLHTSNPLEITGFDNQMSVPNLMPRLDSVLQSLKIPITQSPEYKSQIFPLVSRWYSYSNDSSTVNKIVSYLNDIKTQMLTRLSKNDFWIQTVDNLIQENIQFKNFKKDYWKDMNVRDKQMAANLKWLAETKYANEKIIVWAHNYHVSKYAGHYRDRISWANAANTMGTVFTGNDELMQQTYVIGFTSYKGTAGRLFKPAYKIQKPRQNSFESWMSKDYNYAFVDFKPFNNTGSVGTQPFYMSGATLGNNQYHTNYKAEWNKIFDGVFYIKEMYPCEMR